MEFYLVRFACRKDDEPKYYLLSDEKYDDWCMCEPEEGYKCFVLVWNGNIEKIVFSFDNPVYICEYQPKVLAKN